MCWGCACSCTPSSESGRGGRLCVAHLPSLWLHLLQVVGEGVRGWSEQFLISFYSSSHGNTKVNWQVFLGELGVCLLLLLHPHLRPVGVDRGCVGPQPPSLSSWPVACQSKWLIRNFSKFELVCSGRNQCCDCCCSARRCSTGFAAPVNSLSSWPPYSFQQPLPSHFMLWTKDCLNFLRDIFVLQFLPSYDL